MREIGIKDDWEHLPNGMKLVCDFRGVRALSNKGLNLFQLVLVPVLKSRGIMKNELRVAGEAEPAMDIMDPTLIESRSTSEPPSGRGKATSEVGSSLFIDADQGKPFRRAERKTHQVVLIFVIDARLIRRVANALQESRLASIGTPNYEDAENTIFLSKIGRGRGRRHGE